MCVPFSHRYSFSCLYIFTNSSILKPQKWHAPRNKSQFHKALKIDTSLAWS